MISGLQPIDMHMVIGKSSDFRSFGETLVIEEFL